MKIQNRQKRSIRFFVKKEQRVAFENINLKFYRYFQCNQYWFFIMSFQGSSLSLQVKQKTPKVIEMFTIFTNVIGEHIIYVITIQTFTYICEHVLHVITM